MLSGPPGAGKTMLARRLPGILPPMGIDEALEVTGIYSVAGLLSSNSSLVSQRPFRSPHHHVSLAGLIGGGSGLARPGEISLAHRGVLFLDELPLYRSDALDALRGPLEEGVVFIARSGGVVTFPCRFSLIAAMNPCPCGYADDSEVSCRCSPQAAARYSTRVSGPLMDRFDLQVEVRRVKKHELLGPPRGDASDVIRARVEQARLLQEQRYRSPIVTNASVTKARLEELVLLSDGAREELAAVVDSMRLTGRGTNRLVRLARTIADLAGSTEVLAIHMGEALTYRFTEDEVRAA